MPRDLRWENTDGQTQIVAWVARKASKFLQGPLLRRSCGVEGGRNHPREEDEVARHCDLERADDLCLLV